IESVTEETLKIISENDLMTMFVSIVNNIKEETKLEKVEKVINMFLEFVDKNVENNETRDQIKFSALLMMFNKTGDKIETIRKNMAKNIISEYIAKDEEYIEENNTEMLEKFAFLNGEYSPLQNVPDLIGIYEEILDEAIEKAGKKVLNVQYVYNLCNTLMKNVNYETKFVENIANTLLNQLTSEITVENASVIIAALIENTTKLDVQARNTINESILEFLEYRDDINKIAEGVVEKILISAELSKPENETKIGDLTRSIYNVLALLLNKDEDKILGMMTVVAPEYFLRPENTDLQVRILPIYMETLNEIREKIDKNKRAEKAKVDNILINNKMKNIEEYFQNVDTENKAKNLVQVMQGYFKTDEFGTFNQNVQAGLRIKIVKRMLEIGKTHAETQKTLMEYITLDSSLKGYHALYKHISRNEYEDEEVNGLVKYIHEILSKLDGEQYNLKDEKYKTVSEDIDKSVLGFVRSLKASKISSYIEMATRAFKNGEYLAANTVAYVIIQFANTRSGDISLNVLVSALNRAYEIIKQTDSKIEPLITNARVLTDTELYLNPASRIGKFIKLQVKVKAEEYRNKIDNNIKDKVTESLNKIGSDNPASVLAGYAKGAVTYLNEVKGAPVFLRAFYQTLGDSFKAIVQGADTKAVKSDEFEKFRTNPIYNEIYNDTMSRIEQAKAAYKNELKAIAAEKLKAEKEQVIAERLEKELLEYLKKAENYYIVKGKKSSVRLVDQEKGAKFVQEIVLAITGEKNIDTKIVSAFIAELINDGRIEKVIDILEILLNNISDENAAKLAVIGEVIIESIEGYIYKSPYNEVYVGKTMELFVGMALLRVGMEGVELRFLEVMSARLYRTVENRKSSVTADYKDKISRLLQRVKKKEPIINVIDVSVWQLNLMFESIMPYLFESSVKSLKTAIEEKDLKKSFAAIFDGIRYGYYGNVTGEISEATIKIINEIMIGISEVFGEQKDLEIYYEILNNKLKVSLDVSFSITYLLESLSNNIGEGELLSMSQLVYDLITKTNTKVFSSTVLRNMGKQYMEYVNEEKRSDVSKVLYAKVAHAVLRQAAKIEKNQEKKGDILENSREALNLAFRISNNISGDNVLKSRLMYWITYGLEANDPVVSEVFGNYQELDKDVINKNIEYISQMINTYTKDNVLFMYLLNSLLNQLRITMPNENAVSILTALEKNIEKCDDETKKHVYDKISNYEDRSSDDDL
ncbi:hypothetical protein ACFL58_04800, partial [Elusimicrobiota bacterium]